MPVFTIMTNIADENNSKLGRPEWGNNTFQTKFTQNTKTSKIEGQNIEAFPPKKYILFIL